ncbi:MAG: hypothetical protein H0W39_11085, partial [Sphingomonas sp.]|nr:hypothetical protein [Sphingomonas sp.]
CASPELAQQQGAASISHNYQSEPRLELGRSDFALPVVEYRAPDGTLKVSQGIIVGRDVGPNTRIGLGLFRMKPKYDEDSGLPTGGKSRKVALGVTLRF